MNITVFNGSPRALKSNTHTMILPFMQGLTESGACVENVFLSRNKIKSCKGCFNCWLKTPGKCIQKDNMPELLKKVRQSDIIVFASPLYADNVTGIMKNFIDRLMTLADPRFSKDKNNESVHKPRYEGNPPLIMAVSNCGFPEISHFKVLRLYFRRLARNMHSRVIGEIYRTQGEIFQAPKFISRPVIRKYSGLMNRAGREIAENKKLSKKLISSLEKPLMAEKLYISLANRHIGKILSKLEK